MRMLIGSLFALALLSSGVQAEDYIIRNSYWGRMKTTDIVPSSAAGVANCGDVLKQGTTATPQTQGVATLLEAREWRCGRFFTDETGRHWQLMYSAPISDKPLQLQGWIVNSGAQVFFYSNTGRVFLQMPTTAQPGMPPGALIAPATRPTAPGMPGR